MSKHLYDDGKYWVSSAIVATPHRFYPLANTTASIRRDPLWAGLAFAALGTACAVIYGGLFYWYEWPVLIGVCVAAVLGGKEISILRLDAPGHPRAMIVERHTRLAKLYAKIRDARTNDSGIYSEAEVTE